MFPKFHYNLTNLCRYEYVKKDLYGSLEGPAGSKFNELIIIIFIDYLKKKSKSDKPLEGYGETNRRTNERKNVVGVVFSHGTISEAIFNF